MGWIYSAVRDTVKNVFGIVHRDTSKKIQKMQNLVNLKAKMTQIREKLKILHLELSIFNKLGLSYTKLRAVTIIVLMIVGMIVYDNHCASDCCSDCDNDCGNDCCNDCSSLGPPYFPSTSVGNIFHCGIFSLSLMKIHISILQGVPKYR